MADAFVSNAELDGSTVVVSVLPGEGRRGICDALEALDEAYNRVKFQLFQQFQEAT